MLVEYQFELRHLNAFVAVAEELHFGRAARRLHIAQPALSRTIQQLELSLDCPLLVRTTRSVALTPAGTELADRARAILADCNAAARATLDIAMGRSGRLWVGFSGTTMLHTVSGLLRRFQAQHPTWRLEATERATTAQIRALADGDLDVGFFLAGPDLPAEIDTIDVASDTACIGVPSGHRFAARDSLSLAELGDERLILFPRHRNPDLYDQILDLVTANHTRQVEVEEASSRQVAAGLVAAGLGVSTFTEGMRHLCGPDVVLIPQVEPARSVTITMGWHQDRPNPFLQLLADIEIG